MAERRMFTQKIIDSDAFLDMPLTTQALYFHLNMRADDDGFINNPKKICRMIGASEDDLKLLIAKRFVLAFEKGVIVIKHWRMHNLIRKDRYSPTQYEDEFMSLDIKDNGSYTEKMPQIQGIEEYGNQMATSWQPVGNQMATQDRLGKDSIGEVSLGKSSIVKDSIGEKEEVKEEKNSTTNTCKQVAALFNQICVSYPSVQSLSEARKKAIRARFKTYTLEDFEILFEKAEASDFLKGGNGRNWSANFDWLIRDSNMAKVLDGNYDNKSCGRNQAPNKTAQQLDDFYDMAARWAAEGE
nr:MAG TPA: replisome organizer [Caudoviricetes sp.]